MDAVGYTRISEKDQSNNSLNNQAVGITDYCRNNNLTLHKIFTDNGKSAFTFDRPEWLKLETYIKANKSVRYLIIYHLDRFSRANLMDALIKLHEIESNLKVKLLTVSDSISQDNTDLSIQMMRTINLLFSNNERNRIQDRIKDGNYRSLSGGRYINMAPIGYKNTREPDGKPLIKIDPVKAKYIQKIFKLFNEGMNVEAIRKEVPQLGHKGNSAIQNILSNPTYAAIIKLPAYKGKPAMEINAIHEPIISKHEYYRAQTRLNKRTVTIQASEDIWLRGVLHCHCGRKMTAGNSKSGSGKYYWYYKCQEHQVNFSATKLHKQFMEILDVLSFNKADVKFFQDQLSKSLQGHQNNKGGNIMRLKLELQKTQKKIADVQAKFLLENIDQAVYDNVMNELREKETFIETDIVKSNTTIDSMTSVMNEVLPKLSKLSEVFTGFPLHQRQVFINAVFSAPLSYFEQIYRTPAVHPFFASKALVLKEKRLLEIEQPLVNSGKLPDCTREGNSIELYLQDLLSVFVA